ncbi:DUF167 family protein [Ancylobacter dichloromethanicus]|uniref:UPF0235 protein GCM10017643_44050 n=1 Tax=Ancylobacter dichloromethanicus TaxID=518825 RepID=A0A9W6JC53_9HYPH|nr:DUF167 family protein [Ancylobacter dichloromethanicus]GLK74287.1 hypothetical protein GCM10017643_44050 [Ancylobacter dichloromethanicus]
MTGPSAVPGPAPPWTLAADSVTVTVRATPRGGRDAIEGIVALGDGRRALKARVSAAAEDGKANAALARLLAKAAGIAPSRVALVSGATGRTKSFRLEGDPQDIAARLATLAGAAAPSQ